MKPILENWRGFLKDSTDREIEINQAENGDCGVFAVALLRELLDAGITSAEILLIGDPASYEAPGDSPDFDEWFDIDIFHVAVYVNGQYYDVNGKTSETKMLALRRRTERSHLTF